METDNFTEVVLRIRTCGDETELRYRHVTEEEEGPDVSSVIGDVILALEYGTPDVNLARVVEYVTSLKGGSPGMRALRDAARVLLKARKKWK